jgi:hypothetical protein
MNGVNQRPPAEPSPGPFEGPTSYPQLCWWSLIMGISERGRLLIVIHTFREKSENDVTIRIISSRKATKQETKNYGE